MARHPWVAAADQQGVRFGPQIGAIRRRPVMPRWELYDKPMEILLETGRLVDRESGRIARAVRAARGG